MIYREGTPSRLSDRGKKCTTVRKLDLKKTSERATGKTIELYNLVLSNLYSHLLSTVSRP